ncbi:hypothetical protein PsorP6_001778 [Peronosclerospora sorghi]|uniref:Uncharacterized protein n=1 Tax=Peronosclerospora sorghi TaxID=230839 RepID=A0ACC0WPJ4_9STRA|nr:hypothetical protein PsorP6_001778 [Peronosclerospora sorghi]
MDSSGRHEDKVIVVGVQFDRDVIRGNLQKIILFLEIRNRQLKMTINVITITTLEVTLRLHLHNGTCEKDGSDGVEDNLEVLETRSFRRTRRPRRKPEVIIIDEEDDENENDGAQVGDVPALSSSPDIVLDKEGVSEAVAHPAAALMDTTNTTTFETADLLQKRE